MDGAEWSGFGILDRVHAIVCFSDCSTTTSQLSYHPIKRPSVASSKGDKPTELRMITASKSPRDGLLYVAS